MGLNLNFDNNTYTFIGLCIVAIAGLIIAIVSFIKPDVDLEVQPGGIVDQDGITIDLYLQSKQGIDYMNKYLLNNKFPFYTKIPNNGTLYYNLYGDGAEVSYNTSATAPYPLIKNGSTNLETQFN